MATVGVDGSSLPADSHPRLVGGHLVLCLHSSTFTIA